MALPNGCKKTEYIEDHEECTIVQGMVSQDNWDFIANSGINLDAYFGGCLRADGFSA